jgi:hypothetical protein
MIGIRLAGNITAPVFARSLANFVDLITDVDCAVSRQSRGSIRWDLATLSKNGPAVVEFVPVSRSKGEDYIDAVQVSILDGLDKLSEGPEQPEHYSYSALESARDIAEQSKKLTGMAIYSERRQSFIDQRLFNNIGYLIASGTVSLGSVRGSLDAITVHDGHEFRVWQSTTKQPVTCRFKKSMLADVARHLKQEVEVFGEVHRNSTGEAFLVNVQEFIPLKTAGFPAIRETSGLLEDLYRGVSLREHMDELRNG